MYTFAIIGLVLAIIGGVNLRFELLKNARFGEWTKGYLMRVALLWPVGWMMSYFSMTPLVGPFLGHHWHVLGLLVLNVVGFRGFRQAREEMLHTWRGRGSGHFFCACYIVAALTMVILSWTVWAVGFVGGLLIIGTYVAGFFLWAKKVYELESDGGIDYDALPARSRRRAHGDEDAAEADADTRQTPLPPVEVRWLHQFVWPAAGFLLILIPVIWGTPWVNPAHHSKMLGEVKDIPWEQGVPDSKHVVTCTYPMALEKAPELVQDDGTVHSVGTLSKQRVEIEIRYIGDIGWNGWLTYRRGEAAPGIVVIEGEKAPNDPGRREKATPIRYSPSAFYEFNLQRHLFINGYSDVILDDFTLEQEKADTNWWVVTVMEPTLSWGCPKVLGVIIVNPDTGEINPGIEDGARWYTPEKTPAWVDRVYPFQLVEERLAARGRWSQGRGKGTFTNDTKLFKLVARGAQFSWDAQGHGVWVEQVTSYSNTDEALRDVYTIDTRTGQAYRLLFPEGTAPKNENKIKARAFSAFSNFGDTWEAQRPTLYNVNGEPTNILPVSAGSGGYQGMAMVHFDRDQKGYGSDLQEAQLAYRSNGVSVNEIDLSASEDQFVFVEFVVDMHGWKMVNGNTFFTFIDPATPKVRYIGGPKLKDIELTGEGHSIRIGTDPQVGGDMRTISVFENKTLNPN